MKYEMSHYSVAEAATSPFSGAAMDFHHMIT